MADPKVTLKLLADASGMIRGVAQGSAQVERTLRTTEQNAKARMAGIERALNTGFAALGVAAAAATAIVASGIKRAIDRADELSKAAQRIGTTTEALSRLQYAARLSDVALGDLQTGTRGLIQNMQAALDPATRQAQVFRLLGIEVVDASGKMRNADDVMADIAGIFERMPDGAQKSALAIQLFGRSGQNLIPLLNQGSSGLRELGDELERMGGVVSTEAGKRAEEFNDALTRMQVQVESVFLRLASDLLPTLDSFTETIKDPAFQNGLSSFVQGLSAIAVFAAKATAELANLARFAGEEIAARFNGAEFGDLARMEDELDRARGRRLSRGFGRSERSLAVDPVYQQLVQEEERLAERLRQAQQAAEQAAIAKAAATQQGAQAASAAADAEGDLADRVTQALRANEAARESARRQAEARRAQAQADREAEQALARLEAAQRQWAERTLDIEAALTGPLAVAMREHEKQLADLREAYPGAAQDSEAFIRAQAALEAQLKATTDEIERQRDEAIERVTGGIRMSIQRASEEARLTGATRRERERLLRVLRDQEVIERALLEIEQLKAEHGESAARGAERELERLREMLRIGRELERVQRISTFEGLFEESIESAFNNVNLVEFFRNFGRGIRDIFKRQQIGTDASGKPIFESGAAFSERVGGFINSSAQFLAFAVQTFRQNDSLVRGLTEVAAALPGIGPWAQAAIAIDSLLGGKLLGTNYQRDSSARNITFGAGGVGGSTSVTDVRQRSLFRGRKWRTTTSDLDPQTMAQLTDVFGQIGLATAAAARELAVALPPLISGAFREEYDANGNLVTSVSTVMGRTFEETMDEFARRVAAENLLAVLAQVMPSDTLNALAERWRADATLLQEGASFLLAAQVEISKGLALFTQEQITQVTDLVEALQNPGETLLQTFQRLTGAARSYGGLISGIESQIRTSGLSEYERGILDIELAYRSNIRQANELARSLGLTGARTEDLAKIEELRAIQLANLQKQIERSVESFITGLRLNEQLSPLQARRQLAEGMDALRTAAAAGDLSQAQGLAQDVLGIGRRLMASGADYRGLFAEVEAILRGIQAPEETSLGDLADILLGLPDEIARALFQQRLEQGVPVPEAPLPAPTPVPPGGGGGGGGGGDELLPVVVQDLGEIKALLQSLLPVIAESTEATADSNERLLATESDAALRAMR